MKKLIKWLEPPLPWKMPVTILLGIFFGLGFFVFYISRASSYLGDKPETCINCHVMIPQYANWAHNSHGRVANCNDCHVPHDNMFIKYFYKGTEGMHHAFMFTFRLERQVIIMEEEERGLVQGNCIRCHEKTVNMRYMMAVQPDYHNYLKERYCIDCHRELPHGRVHGLATTPNALTVQKSESRVAGWILKNEE